MELTTTQAIWFLLTAGPVAMFIAWSDLSSMRIPNKSVMVLLGVFVIVGFITLPFTDYLWRFAHFAAILAIGFVMNMLRLVGGGDAKYAAAMAPFMALGDVRSIVVLFAAMLLAAFATHRIFMRIPPVRRLTSGWKSWDAGGDFPMGLALSGALIGYFLMALV